MYSVFVHTKPLKKKTSSTNRAIMLQLQQLLPGTEMNVHTAKQTYYNAIFQSFNPRKGTVTLLTDQFYPNDGKTITVHIEEITSLDTPSSARSDDEEE
ncbi:hypothetical protein [Anoxybacillus sp. J5B_2022]|uniref:hypothetical protein n=1 Tax=Anoxybacillus sp. J5B_2022 TaxID=3003246 RepID=UPI002285D2F0|nr:hypothetical protein [Anoxybacillus sp. J5B_2022]MCZ0756162.1 hypothetical protein [Anoxybacillus sp. J5B_2022]